MRRFRMVLAGTALASLLAACGSGVRSTDAHDANQTSTAAASSPKPPAALQFSAPSVGGGTIDFTQFAGQTVALWFWAPT